MIKAILIDDEMHCLKTLAMLLKEYCANVQVLEKCNDAATGLKAIELHKPDIVFLDIEMPQMNGFEMLERLPHINFSVVFTTGYDQYAIKAFHFSALDYLLKPIEPKELINAVKKVEEQRHLPLAEQFEMLLKKINGINSGFNKIAVPTAEGFELVPATDVIYFEANDNYTYIFLKNKNRIIACRTLKKIEEQIQDYNFFVRVHNSYMVNLNEVVRYVRGEGGYLVMSNNISVNVSRSRKDDLLKFF
ncbi:MAG: LytTR family DNA-binding domain-containing protein [Bacteroidota bacterium]|nr:LytTR family DNA-binding domain-containing protein [Bacteroidota bacterium]